MGRRRLIGGSHTRPNGEKVHVGETFEPTTEELEGPLRERTVPAGSVFTMPDTSHIDWSDDGREEDGAEGGG